MEDKLGLHLQDPALPPILFPTHEISGQRSMKSLMTTLMLLAETKNRTPCSTPTSFLNTRYGVLFQHIGQLHQSVYKHYLVVALKIPHIHNMPQAPEEWYKGCGEGLPLLKKYYEDQTFQTIFNEDYCAKDRIRTLYIELTQLLHSTIPALLPNQLLPYADYHFFNKTPEELPTNSYGSTASKRVQ